jgi:putative membrane protein
MMLGWWLLVAVAVVVAARLGGRTPSPQRRGPREILAERFARGEIDGVEYRERLEVLERGS